MIGPVGYDAIVVGAGHNGLVAANLLVDAGWQVLVVEGAAHAGGAVHSDDSLHPGYVTDEFSAFYPLGAASPVLSALELDRWGLTWSHAPLVLAHVLPDDRCAVLSRDISQTAASLNSFADGDGERWAQITADFESISEPLLLSLLSPFPPIRAAGRLLRRLGAADALRFARFAVLPVRRYAEENFRGEGAALLLAGNALHTDLAPENAGSAIYGWLMAMLGQTVGFPVPVGGSGVLTKALVDRFVAAGGEIRLSCPAEQITVVARRARGVQLAGGEHVTARAILADVAAPTLYRDLIGLSHLPARLADDLDRFQWDAPTLKVNWALSAPVPWLATSAQQAGTVHLGADMNGLTRFTSDLATQEIPEHPFLLFGQMSISDSSRSPAGTESAWAYTHLPAGRDLHQGDIDRHVQRVEATVDKHAPGFRNLVLARSVQGPRQLQASNPNLVDGAVGAGTSAMHQQLIFRPIPGLGRAETPIDGLYLAGSAAHPGGGVHGAAGANAARAALSRERRTGRVRRRGLDLLWRGIYGLPKQSV